jgi:hypothetical protein
MLKKEKNKMVYGLENWVPYFPVIPTFLFFKKKFEGKTSPVLFLQGLK